MDEAEHCDRIAIIDHGTIVAIDTPGGAEGERRARTGWSCGPPTTRLRCASSASRFGLEPTTAEGAIRVYVANGDRFIPRLFAELTVPIVSVSVAQPTLDDVFMSYTGRTIRDAEATASERMAANPFIRRRTGARR